MKKISLFLTVLIFSLSTLIGQTPKEKREKIKEMKIAFITEKLQLTPEEAEKFWPVYNAFEQKHRELKKNYRQKVKDLLGIKGKEPVNVEKYSDKQIAEVLDLHMQMKEKQLQLDKEYYQALKNVLPVKKIFLLHQAEREFKKKMLKEIKGKAVNN